MMQSPTRPVDAASRPTAAEFRAALRSFAGAVTIVAAGPEGQRCGLTATAICSVSDDPPTMLACINLKSASNPLISTHGSFSINVLASSHREVAMRFAGHDGVTGENRFSDPGWGVLATGAPVFTDALVVLDCRLIEARTMGSHTIFIGAVAACRAQAGLEPLVYVNGAFRGLA
jgi:flavin reductase (DIM6/NTAB) family NADH-FMN oxidoreductase RutF